MCGGTVHIGGLEYLEHPAEHGLIIKSFIASDGTPCLVCTPTRNLEQRGIVIRQQLTARGISLESSGKIMGTLVLIHGRKGRKEDYLAIAERFCAVGFRCVIPDMPAHGDNPATIATYGIREAGIPTRVLTEASKQFSFEPQPVGLLGMSMGGAVAIYAADQPVAPWKALDSGSRSGSRQYTHHQLPDLCRSRRVDAASRPGKSVQARC